MTAEMRERLAGLLPAVYGVALAIVLLPSLELLAAITPLGLGSVRWRFGAVGFALQTLTTLLLGLTFAAVTAVALGHRGVARGIAVVAAVAGALVLLATAFATLDFLQLRAEVTEGARERFDRAGWKMILQGVVGAPVLLALAAGTWRGSGTLAVAAVRETEEAGSFRAVVIEGSGQSRK